MPPCGSQNKNSLGASAWRPGARRRAGRTKKRPRRTFVPVGLSTRWPYPSHPNAARLPSDARALTPRTFRCPSPRFSAAAPPFPGLRRPLPGAASRRERDPPPFRGRFLALSIAEPPERAMRTRTPGRLARRCPWSPWAARRTRWTARMLGDLFSNGLDVVDDHEEADAVIVNTCAFVEDAKNESVDAIIAAAALKAESEERARRKNHRHRMPRAEVRGGPRGGDARGGRRDGVRGVQNLPGEDRRRPAGVARTPPPPHHARARPRGHRVGPPSAPRPCASASPRSITRTSASPRVRPRVHVLRDPRLPRQVPLKPFDVIVEEAEALVDGGARELNLIAEDTNQYGSDWASRIAARLAGAPPRHRRAPRLQWIRLLCTLPVYFSRGACRRHRRHPGGVSSTSTSRCSTSRTCRYCA